MLRPLFNCALGDETSYSYELAEISDYLFGKSVRPSTDLKTTPDSLADEAMDRIHRGRSIGPRVLNEQSRSVYNRARLPEAAARNPCFDPSTLTRMQVLRGYSHNRPELRPPSAASIVARASRRFRASRHATLLLRVINERPEVHEEPVSSP